MLLVTKVEAVKVPLHFHTLHHWPSTPSVFEGRSEDMTIATELVQGRKFVISGEEIIIGWSAQVREILGPLEVRQNMKEDLFAVEKLFKQEKAKLKQAKKRIKGLEWNNYLRTGRFE